VTAEAPILLKVPYAPLHGKKRHFESHFDGMICGIDKTLMEENGSTRRI